MIIVLEFVIGYDLEEFKKYYQTLDDLHNYYKTQYLDDIGSGELRESERKHIEKDSRHLIVWRQEREIVGHVIWHETSTYEMTEGDPRGEDDRKKLQTLFGERRNNLVELHEVWLRTDFRGRGYGKQFFEFFERFASEQGFDGIIYYTDNRAAIALCKKRGYKESPTPLSGTSRDTN